MVLSYIVVGMLFNLLAIILVDSTYIVDIITYGLVIWELVVRYFLIKYRVKREDIMVNKKIIFFNSYHINFPNIYKTNNTQVQSLLEAAYNIQSTKREK